MQKLQTFVKPVRDSIVNDTRLCTWRKAEGSILFRIWIIVDISFINKNKRMPCWRPFHQLNPWIHIFFWKWWWCVLMGPKWHRLRLSIKNTDICMYTNKFITYNYSYFLNLATCIDDHRPWTLCKPPNISISHFYRIFGLFYFFVR